ncbi:hypothetical protein FKP32DRAFT_1543912, partial [Trametes sanguinea]
LLVEEACDAPPPPNVKVACFQVIICPSKPLEIGTPVSLAILPLQDRYVPFIPNNTMGKISAIPLHIAGPIVGVRTESKERVVFVVDNWCTNAPIRRAYVNVPRIPGITARADIWTTVAAVVAQKEPDV